MYAGLCSNEIHTAIVNRSASHLQAALQRSPESIDESNDAGHTPLHLAANWPHGLSLLLSHGVNLEKTDLFGLKAIEQAMFLGCTDAVQKLLKAGCNLELVNDNLFAFAIRLLHFPALGTICSTVSKDDFEIVKLIIEELVSRGSASTSEKDSTVLDSDPTMDIDNVGAEHSVQSITKSVSQSKSSLLHIPTPYHCEFLTVEIANELWSAGFREIDTPNDFHTTPLMRINPAYSTRRLNNIKDNIEYAFWLCQKGASLYRPQRATHHPKNSKDGSNVPPFETLAIHSVAQALRISVGREVGEYWEYCVGKGRRRARTLLGFSFPARLEPLIYDLSIDCQHFLHKIMVDASPDGCICACSRHGCLPVTLFLKRKKLRWYDPRKEQRYTSEWRLLWLFDNVPSGQFSKSVFHAIVRLMTFEKLGLRHTCCEWVNSNSVDAEEAEEIRDEDREDIQLLESLLQKFEENYDDRDIITWLDEYWHAEMEEILAARDCEPLDEAGLREVGVILCQDHDRLS